MSVGVLELKPLAPISITFWPLVYRVFAAAVEAAPGLGAVAPVGSVKLMPAMFWPLEPVRVAVTARMVPGMMGLEVESVKVGWAAAARDVKSASNRVRMGLSVSGFAVGISRVEIVVVAFVVVAFVVVFPVIAFNEVVMLLGHGGARG